MTMSCAPSSSAGVGEAVPVYDVLPFPSGTMALSASGSAGVIRVWDLVAGGRCVRAMSNHQKAVTSLAFDGSASRLLSGGLDHMVKVYDVSTYKVVHTMRYPAPVLCLAVSVSYNPTSCHALRVRKLSLASPSSNSLMILILALGWEMEHSLYAGGNQKRPKTPPHQHEHPKKMPSKRYLMATIFHLFAGRQQRLKGNHAPQGMRTSSVWNRRGGKD